MVVVGMAPRARRLPRRWPRRGPGCGCSPLPTSPLTSPVRCRLGHTSPCSAVRLEGCFTPSVYSGRSRGETIGECGRLSPCDSGTQVWSRAPPAPRQGIKRCPVPIPPCTATHPVLSNYPRLRLRPGERASLLPSTGSRFASPTIAPLVSYNWIV
jgi:hypothetical protein